MRYLDCPEGTFPWIDPAVVQIWHGLIGESPPCLSREIHRAAFAILWMGLRGKREGLPSMLATSFAEAAGVAGRQKVGSCVVQQRTGVTCHRSDSGWSALS